VWCFVDYRLADPAAQELPLDTLWDFSPTEYYPAKPFTQFWAVKNGQEVLYTRRQGGPFGGTQYVDATGKPWSRESNGLLGAIIREDKGQKVRFKRDLPGGKFKLNELAVYREEGGRRALTENDVQAGQMVRRRTGLLIANIVVNLLLLVLWFVLFW